MPLRSCRVLGNAAYALFVLAGGVGYGAEALLLPDFDLEVEAPAALWGPPGASLDYRAEAVLLSSDGDPVMGGARAWSIGIEALDGGAIVTATTAGTVADRKGKYLQLDGYVNIELIQYDDPGKENYRGVICAVILSFTLPVTLPPEGRALLLNLEARCQVPEAGVSQIRLAYVDSLMGAGQPVRNTITYGLAYTHRDDGGELDNDKDGYGQGVTLFLAEARFVRGDVDSSGSLNVSDAIEMLDYLFLGARRLGCEAVADTNDDGLLNLTDAVGLLRHLFQGASAPAPPYPRCGYDPTIDGLACAESLGCA